MLWRRRWRGYHHGTRTPGVTTGTTGAATDIAQPRRPYWERP